MRCGAVCRAVRAALSGASSDYVLTWVNTLHTQQQQRGGDGDGDGGRLQMRSTPSSAFVTPKARYPNQYEDDLDSDGLLDDSRCMDGDSSSDDEEIGSPSVSAEDVGLVPSTWEVSGAWAVLICGTIITLVTIAYTVLEIVNPAGAGSFLSHQPTTLARTHARSRCKLLAPCVWRSSLYSVTKAGTLGELFLFLCCVVLLCVCSRARVCADTAWVILRHVMNYSGTALNTPYVLG